MTHLLRHFIRARRSSKLSIALLASALLISPLAHAKKVSLEWKEIKGASKYEIQVTRDGKPVVTKVDEETKWSGNLDFGLYTYQIRAIDRIKRPGAWSAAKPLVVMPLPPKAVYPEDGTLISLFNPDATTLFKWSEVKGTRKYVFELRQGPKAVRSETVKGTEFSVKGLGTGKYSWRVTAIIESSDRMPASLTGRQWQSKPSSDEAFKVEVKTLAKPEITYPVGSVSPPGNKKLKFKWAKVDGAEAYEVKIHPLDKAGRMIASALDQTLITTERTLIANVSERGKFKWEVRALANIDSSKKAEAVGGQSTAEFSLDPNAGFEFGAGYVALSLMLAPYDYTSRAMSGGGSAGGTASSASTTYRGSGEYFFAPNWGFGLAFEKTDFTIEPSQAFSRLAFEATLKYRVKLTDQKYGWFLYPKIGIERRDYPFLDSQSNSVILRTNFRATGPSIGFDLRKQITEKFSFGGKFSYFIPASMSTDFSNQGANSTTINSANLLSGSESSRNLSLGLQGLYWVNNRIGLGAGGFVEDRSIATSVNVSSFRNNSFSTSDGTASVTMDAWYFFTSFIYAWGR